MIRTDLENCLISALCSHYSYPFLRLDGSTSTVQRQQVVSRFNNPHCDDFVLLLSSKAGGTGTVTNFNFLTEHENWTPVSGFWISSQSHYHLNTRLHSNHGLITKHWTIRHTFNIVFYSFLIWCQVKRTSCAKLQQAC